MMPGRYSAVPSCSTNTTSTFLSVWSLSLADNLTGLLALANEYNKAGRYEDEAAVLVGRHAAHEDEGNAYLRLGEVLVRLGQEDETRTTYEEGIRQAEKLGHSGTAEDLHLTLVELGGPVSGETSRNGVLSRNKENSVSGVPS